MGWIKNDPFLKYIRKFDKVERGYLTEEQLNTIETHQFKSKRLAVVRDLFVFSCYTGLAYIDVKGLAKHHLVKGVDGKLWIKTHRKKNSNPASSESPRNNRSV
jgi:hypothetical protein